MSSSEEKLAYSLICFIDQTPNSCLNTALNIYSPCLCFHPLNHNHDTKEALMCHSVPVFLRACFNPWQFFNALHGCNQTLDQPVASMHPNMYFSYRKYL